MALRSLVMLIVVLAASLSPAADFYSGTPQQLDPYASTPAPMPPSLPIGSARLTDPAPIAGALPPVVMPPPVISGPNGGVAPAGFFVSPSTLPPPAQLGTMIQPGGWSLGPVKPAQYTRFIHDVRARYTWISGDGQQEPTEFGIQDIEGAVTFALPNFLFCQQPIFITPAFIYHQWEAPNLTTPPFPPSFELPEDLYSAYIDFYYAPQITPHLGAELDFRIGVYSDFGAITADAIRPQGYGAAVVQLTPSLAVKAGATYVNRVDVKVLPVGGVVWTPNPQTYFSAVFPNPKLSKFLWTWGCADVWAYVAGEFGGGSWHAESLGDSQVDINDLRAIAGLEWIGGWVGTRGFVEFGYVFDREVVIEGQAARLSPDDAFMARAGLAF